MHVEKDRSSCLGTEAVHGREAVPLMIFPATAPTLSKLDTGIKKDSISEISLKFQILEIHL